MASRSRLFMLSLLHPGMADRRIDQQHHRGPVGDPLQDRLDTPQHRLRKESQPADGYDQTAHDHPFANVQIGECDRLLRLPLKVLLDDP
ncbi:MAG: hypothetical protein P8Y94_06130, partial [Acidobacteriota bacterium]